MFIALVTWFTTARKHFSGPEIEGIVDLVEGRRRSDSEEVGVGGEKKAPL